MNCRNCQKIITNPRNAVNAENEVYCCHECFLARDSKLEQKETLIEFIQTRIRVLRQMKMKMYYLTRPAKSVELDIRILNYRQDLERVYNELRAI
jgi:hypothetical protein